MCMIDVNTLGMARNKAEMVFKTSHPHLLSGTKLSDGIVYFIYIFVYMLMAYSS